METERYASPTRIRWRSAKRWKNLLRRPLNCDALRNQPAPRRQAISITNEFSCNSWTHSDARNNMLQGKLSQLRFKEHSFFGSLLPQTVIVADFGAHRGEFFAALKSEYSISRALLVEANPALAETLKETFGKESDVLHAAVVGGNSKGAVTFTRSTNPESSSIFKGWSAAYGISDQVDVPDQPIKRDSEVGRAS